MCTSWTATIAFTLGAFSLGVAMQAAPCHKAGPNTPGAASDFFIKDGGAPQGEGPGVHQFDKTLIHVVKKADGDLFIKVFAHDGGATSHTDEQTDPTKRLTIVDPPPQNVNCCHPVEWEGKSKIQIHWRIINPQPGDLAEVKIGTEEDPAKTEFVATTDNCGTPISKDKRVEIFFDLKCDSVAPAAPVCTMTGFLRTVDEGVPEPATPIGPAVELRGQRQRFLDFFKTAQYLRQTALKVINRGRVEVNAPPQAEGFPAGQGPIRGGFGTLDVDVIKQKLMDSVEPVTSD